MPTSYAADLGVQPSECQMVKVRSVSGTVEACGAKVPVMFLGTVPVKDVDVVFADNTGGASYLGQNVLQRFTTQMVGSARRLTLK